MEKKAMYGLPEHVEFCKRCVMSNQKPNSAKEFKHNINSKKETISFHIPNLLDKRQK